MRPSYLELSLEELQWRIDAAWELMRSPCRVCPRHCKVDRTADDRRGFCHTGLQPIIASYAPHFGEERPLVGRHGSGTIFFAGCSLACAYCQNWEISQLRRGCLASEEDLAGIMLYLQRIGCHNINLVTPTHVVPQILAALPYAVQGGLHIPLVYNTGGFDALEALRLLDGIVDVYMPDIKYSDNAIAAKHSLIKGYYEVSRAAVKEMYRQVGDLVLEDGLAVRGLIIRHLVLPGGLAGTAEVVRFIAQEVSPNSYVNIMAQYRPEHKAFRYPGLSRRITAVEHREAMKLAVEAGLWRFAD